MMRNALLSLVTCLLTAFSLHAQIAMPDSIPAQEYQQKVAVVCVYDYQEAIVSKLSNSTEGEQPIHFLVAQRNGDNGFILNEKPTFDQMMHEVSTGRDLLLFVHGFGNTLNSVLENTTLLSWFYNVDLVIFAWACKEVEGKNIQNYKLSRENVVKSTPRFAETVIDVHKYLEKHPKIKGTVMFHSLGNLFAKKLAHYTINHAMQFKPTFNNVVLNAPCVYERDHDIWSDLLRRFVKGNVYVTRHDNDGILKSAALFMEGGPLLGVSDIFTYSNYINYVDFTKILARYRNNRVAHGYFYGESVREHPAIKQYFYDKVLHGEQPNWADTTHFLKMDDEPYTSYLLIDETL